MIQNTCVHVSGLARCAVDLRPPADVARKGTEVAGRGAGVRRSLEEGPPRDRGSA